ncbi:hypothetical protein VRU48_11380 [Pedobacter sp. KR3-3]|uniref:DUF4595 domain-containing protein n=1 Tax=Pedobacter albus TaxID=3113905 RepID=A0ABU7I8B1_9SPHI|nr:hypothetical protein [Pedobacter sp. KR3-3]MEE1945710.1 hypothetical protein [Pedobacter sp. KR3-3]
MKRISYFLAFIVLLSSCSKDKEPITKEAQCKVSSMDDLVYSYNDKGELVKLENGLYKKELAYTGNKIDIVYTAKVAPTVTRPYGTVTLDDKGRLGRFVNDQQIFDAKYDASGYLTEVKLSDIITGNAVQTSTLSYQDGNLVKIVSISANGTITQKNIAYSATLNQATNGWYADFPLAEVFQLRCPELIGLCGKRSRNLLREINTSFSNDASLNEKDVWSFVWNNNGNITSASFQFSSKSMNTSDTFRFGYQCN